MTIESRVSRGIDILDVNGRLTVDANREISLADRVRDLIRGGRRQILVNLEQVSSIDSTGVRDIVEAYATTTRQNGSLKLLKLPAKVRNVLTITRLLTILEAYDTEGEALSSFGTATPV